MNLMNNGGKNGNKGITMKFLLTAINAKYIHSNLAVYELYAYAMQYKKPDLPLEIAIAEYTINQHVDEILGEIYKQRPDVLCFSCYIWNIGYVTELVREYRKLCPKVPVWVGGPEVSYETEQLLLDYPQITGAMMGEGEQTFLELCEHYAGREGELGEIAGIAYRDDTGIRVTSPREPVPMDRIPFCYGATGDFSNRIIYYESSRGCPFCCSYCLSSVDKRLRFRSVETVKRELTFFLEKQVPQVKFVDRTFNCSHEHAMEIWRFIHDNDNGMTNFHFEISADLLTEEELELLGRMRPGLVQLEIGVQSTNEATIGEIHRTMNLEKLKSAVRTIQSRNNIHEHLDLIAGLPYEDYDTFAKSFDEIYELKPNQLQLGFLKVLKGSYLYEHRQEYGILYRDTPPYEVLQTNWLNFSELLCIRQVEEMLEVYYNSGQYEVTMKLLETQFDSPFRMFRRLGEFYEKKGYFSMSHSRIRRAGILLEFAEEEAGTAGGIWKESLTYDLYARENLKSRPDWAPDVAEWKDITRKFCKNGKQSHVERFYYCFPGKYECTADRLPERQKEPKYVLFDYTERDPLDRQALQRYVDV